MKLPLLLLLCIQSRYCYHILCLHHIPSISHHHLAKGIVLPLLKASHKVTWVTPFPNRTLEHENLKIIDVSSIFEVTGSLDEKLRQITGISMIKEITKNISQATLQNEGVRQALIHNQYDAVVSEWFFSDVEAGYAAIQQVPWILLNSITMHPHLENLIDTVRSVPTNPIIFDYPIPMSFKQRLLNTAIYLLSMFDAWKDRSYNAALYESSFSHLAKARGVNLPPYLSALYNISILFVNSHPSFTSALSLPPNVIEIGGFHIDEVTPDLPMDLQQILDASPQGAIFFSMGSLLKSSSLPEKTKEELIKMLASLPYTVLWKFEENIENLPKNIHIRKWLPQTSILAHPNTKVFITHAGLLSTLESLYYGVPMLAIPVFGDQPRNADSAVRAGRAIKVHFGPDMVPDIKNGLETLLKDNSFYKRVQKLSQLFKNRPVPPSKLILHYIELAIETKGAYHLRSTALLYSWYELLMLDQIVVFVCIALLLYFIVKLFLRLTIYSFKTVMKSVIKEKEA